MALYLPGIAGRFRMGASVLKRLLIALVTVAFMGANLPVSCVGMSTMPGPATMAAAMDEPCLHCSSSAPATEMVKMTCGALACAGIVGLPIRQVIVMADLGDCLHATSEADAMAGISLKPDPFPPKPTHRV